MVNYQLSIILILFLSQIQKKIDLDDEEKILLRNSYCCLGGVCI